MTFEVEDVICIIPARGGSKGLPRKNVLTIGSESLIARPIRHAIESGVIGTVLVTTDDAEIAEIAKSAGAIVPFIRPPELAQDLTSTEDTLQHALFEYEKMTGKEFKVAVFLTATDIFRRVEWIVDVVNRLKSNPNLESVFVGLATHKNYWNQQSDGSLCQVWCQKIDFFEQRECLWAKTRQYSIPYGGCPFTRKRTVQ